MSKKRKKSKMILILVICIYIYKSISLCGGEEIIYLSQEGGGRYYYSNLDCCIDDIEDKLCIRRINYSWNRTLTGKNNPKTIVFHHTDGDNLSPYDINEIHKEKGWDGIGYHYYIREDGTIFSGRPEECIGSHVYGDNKDSLGICLEGNFENEEPTEEEIDSLVNLSVYLILKYNISETINHKDLYNTLCPGRFFPKEEVDEKIREKILSYYTKNSYKVFLV